MKRKEAEQKQITIYWWNFRKKTLDFKGTIKDFLLKKDITIRKIKGDMHRIEYVAGTSTFRIKTCATDFVELSTIAIKSFLTYLGDKTIFYDGHGREHKLNWR